MGRIEHKPGEVFGRLTTIGGSKVVGKRCEVFWECICECGKKLYVSGYNLRRGITQSCGCLRNELCAKMTTKHGYSDPNSEFYNLYRVWFSMKARCLNPKSKNYKYYGGRGICVCSNWLESPQSFISWAIKNGYKNGLEIDRINNHKGYSPENCRFVTRSENLKNQRVVQSNNKTGFRGVSQRASGKYRASTFYNGRAIYIGTYSTAESAAIARDDYVLENSINTPLNFPKETRG